MHNPRFIAYAKHHGRTSAEQLAADAIHYPGGCMAGYINWINERWREWRTLTGRTRPHGYADHADFDKWLANYPTLHLAC